MRVLSSDLKESQFLPLLPTLDWSNNPPGEAGSVLKAAYMHSLLVYTAKQELLQYFLQACSSYSSFLPSFADMLPIEQQPKTASEITYDAKAQIVHQYIGAFQLSMSSNEPNRCQGSNACSPYWEHRLPTNH